MAAKAYEDRPGYYLVFRRYITDKKGNKIYPKNGKVFPIWIKEKSDK